MATYYVDGAVGSDANTGTSPGAGNAWATIGKALATIAADDLAYVKASATYGISTGLTTTNGGLNHVTRLVAYASSPGDGGKATIQATAAILMLTVSQDLWSFENFIFDGNSLATQGVKFSGSWTSILYNCIIKNCVGEGFLTATNSTSLINVEITGCGGTNGALALTAGVSSLSGVQVHGNTVTGVYISTSSGITISDSLIANNSGASSDGIALASGNYNINVRRTRIHGNGRHGLYIPTYNILGEVADNIFTSNGGYGIDIPAISTAVSDPRFHHNAFYNNTSGARSAALLAGPGDVTLTGDPYTISSGGDFTLNTTAGAGAACRAAGFPGAMNYGGTGYADIGGLQHQDTGGGGGTTVIVVDDD